MSEKRRSLAGQVRRIARETFGYKDLRPGQEAAIKSVLEGRDTLAVMPTGSGKSAIYQISGIQIAGPTVIVSPMIALQRDQVESIKEQDVAEAALLNSTLKASEQRETFESLKEGGLEFLFLAPEQFNRDEVLESVKNAKPSLFVIDEAHCISEWGHDFRPDYLKLGAIIENLGHPIVLALTATAAPPVREEIMERLGMRDPQVVVQGFDRPNIWLEVERYDEELPKKNALLERVEQAEKPGIVYASTRKRAEELAEALCERGIEAAAYHAGMKTAEREQVQSDFMADSIEVIVATTAFGMGIDKANVRFVYHYDISDSIDAYYQEIGRAGRDGKEAEAILFYRPEDMGIRRFFASSGQVEVDQVERVAHLVNLHDGPVDVQELREESGLSQSKLMTALHRLEDAGAIETLPDGEIVPTHEADTDLTQALQEVARSQEQHENFSKSRLEMMRGYAEMWGCRREYLLNYFGEGYDPPCDFCDNCEEGYAATQATQESDAPFPLNSRVAHKVWGEGMVMRYEEGKIVVLFDSVGYKTLDLGLVVANKLLVKASR